MESILLTLNIIFAIILIILILLQKSEGGALGIGVSQESFMFSRSAGNFLTKATAIIATLFVICSLSLTIIGRKDLPSSTSVIDKIEEKEDDSLPKIPKNKELNKRVSFIRSKLNKKFNNKNSVKLIYGGSVNAENVSKLISIQGINGFLIGGSSQSGKKFIDILKNCYM